MLKNIVYNKTVKGNVERSERVVHVISPISDTMLALDLTSYSPEERDYIDKELEAIHREYLDNIAELGLRDNWRRFKKDGLSD